MAEESARIQLKYKHRYRNKTNYQFITTSFLIEYHDGPCTGKKVELILDRRAKKDHLGKLEKKSVEDYQLLDLTGVCTPACP